MHVAATTERGAYQFCVQKCVSGMSSEDLVAFGQYVPLRVIEHGIIAVALINHNASNIQHEISVLTAPKTKKKNTNTTSPSCNNRFE